MYPELTPAFCTQLSFGVDVHLTPAQVGAIRDTVLALFPAATLPWYFGELHQGENALYEIAASVGASGRTQPDKPYNVFVRLARVDERGFQAPSVRELFHILEPVGPSHMFCSAQFVIPVEQGSPPLPLWQQIPKDVGLGRLLVESYTVVVHDDEGGRLGTVLVAQPLTGAHYYTVSFSMTTSPSMASIDEAFRYAVALIARVHRAEGEVPLARNAGSPSDG